MSQPSSSFSSSLAPRPPKRSHSEMRGQSAAPASSSSSAAAAAAAVPPAPAANGARGDGGEPAAKRPAGKRPMLRPAGYPPLQRAVSGGQAAPLPAPPPLSRRALSNGAAVMGEGLTVEEIRFGILCLTGDREALVNYYNAHQGEIDLSKIIDRDRNTFFHLVASRGDIGLMNAVLDCYEVWNRAHPEYRGSNPLAIFNLITNDNPFYDFRPRPGTVFEHQNALELLVSNGVWNKPLIKRYAKLAPEAMERFVQQRGYNNYLDNYHTSSHPRMARPMAIADWWEQSREKRALVLREAHYVCDDVMGIIEGYLSQPASLDSSPPASFEMYAAQPRQDPWLVEYTGQRPSRALPANFTAFAAVYNPPAPSRSSSSASLRRAGSGYASSLSPTQ